ncbi:uncharacterized protein SPPG_05205 [Spizellomyces punctatus DAOM BR117]|uniref:LITAF domain-containing protein n=1 Tax=Spizellomyces punctatus (strain DAOM BR117) TaxID=645134 RepID=A0A0L0HFM7_SPIPD|nr:uncharacterized protein SPPG_05205 [Spizellomyces punctatus DAOM BR117]KNC99831.1 hypothetical protein SPPG_05205 [Spizellomyces punctatus DAOM BR117]|eukprot:XP_016607871.1 hypothetical protein SPPG_05205 [Spizellomyces punctatus DAOM BR117]
MSSSSNEKKMQQQQQQQLPRGYPGMEAPPAYQPAGPSQFQGQHAQIPFPQPHQQQQQQQQPQYAPQPQPQYAAPAIPPPSLQAHPQVVLPPGILPQGVQVQYLTPQQFSQQPTTTTIIYVAHASQPLSHHPTPTTCPHCHTPITTIVQKDPGIVAWFSSIALCFSGCVFGCCLIPLMNDSFKDSRHLCPRCMGLVGIKRR